MQFDYAPDFKDHQLDVTRVFPANGRFTPRQREFYTIYLELYRALMTSIRVHQTPKDIIKDAVLKMDRVMASFAFTDEKIKTAAAAFVTRYRTGNASSLGHDVGMEVHDVTRGAGPTLEPGRIFTIEPAMILEDEHIGIRLEDMLLDHRRRLREPVVVRPDRDRRDRTSHGRAGLERSGAGCPLISRRLSGRGAAFDGRKGGSQTGRVTLVARRSAMRGASRSSHPSNVRQGEAIKNERPATSREPLACNFDRKDRHTRAARPIKSRELTARIHLESRCRAKQVSRRFLNVRQRAVWM